MKPWVLALPLNLINQVSKQFDVDPHVIAAMVSVESNGEACATRYEPHYKWTLDPEPYAKINKITVQTEMVGQKTSWGLLQVMGAVSREYGHEGFLTELCDPLLGLTYGVKHLKNYIEQHKDIGDAISSYNQGSPKKTNSGEYKNKYYVDEVLRRVRYLKNAAF